MGSGYEKNKEGRLVKKRVFHEIIVRLYRR